MNTRCKSLAGSKFSHCFTNAVFCGSPAPCAHSLNTRVKPHTCANRSQTLESPALLLLPVFLRAERPPHTLKYTTRLKMTYHLAAFRSPQSSIRTSYHICCWGEDRRYPDEPRADSAIIMSVPWHAQRLQEQCAQRRGKNCWPHIWDHTLWKGFQIFWIAGGMRTKENMWTDLYLMKCRWGHLSIFRDGVKGHSFLLKSAKKHANVS